MTTQTGTTSKLAPLADDDGVLAMLALDQRESLRTMLAGDKDPSTVADAALVGFKTLAANILTPHATAVLLDRSLGLSVNSRASIADDCALILAADVLHQPPGEAVRSTEFDESITVDVIRSTGAVALKLLVMWTEDGRDVRRRITDAFLDRCRKAEVVAVVEGIVVPPESGFASGQRDAAVLAAAQELATGADLYKAQVPGYVVGDTSAVLEASAYLTESIEVPWVVLSNGVHTEDFPDAVRQACLGGAQGFLAGRAIWADTVCDADPSEAMRTRSIARLTELRAIVAETTAKRHKM